MPRLVGKKITTEFVLTRPLIEFRWEDIITHSNNSFELQSVEPIYDTGETYINHCTDMTDCE